MSACDNLDPDDINRDPERSDFGKIRRLLSHPSENPRSLESIILSVIVILLWSIFNLPDSEN